VLKVLTYSGHSDTLTLQESSPSFDLRPIFGHVRSVLLSYLFMFKKENRVNSKDKGEFPSILKTYVELLPVYPTVL